jgi:hypothetical protein
LKLTRRHKTLAAAAGAGLAGSIALAFAVPALADGYDSISINDGNVPTTAEDFSDRSCDQIPGDTADWLDGWVFVLPASVPAEGNFKYIEAVFKDEDGNVLRYNTDDDGGIVSGSGDNKAYIVTPAGLTLIDADASVDLEEDGKGKGKDKVDEFNLTHTCPATEDEPGEETTTPGEEPSSPGEETTTPGEEPSSPGEETTTPGEEPSSPGEETTTPGEEPSSPGEETTTPGEEPSSPDEETTSPAEEPSSPGEETTTPGEQSSSPAPSTSTPHQPSTTPVASLPTTGSPLIWVLAAAGALLVAGAVILVFMSRRSGTEKA